MRNRIFFSAAIALLAASAERTKATMAAPVDKVPDLTNPNPTTDDLRIQLNNGITALRGIAAKLDLDATVTDANYFALWLDAAIATAPVKIKAG